MDAQPELALLARVLEEHGLKAVLIGNLAAAMHGAPISTIDIDFCFRSTRPNIVKLKAMACRLISWAASTGSGRSNDFAAAQHISRLESRKCSWLRSPT